jgi:hypothetical protein
LSQELYNLLQSLLKAALLLYEIYTPHVHAAVLLLLAYLAFKCGRLTIADPLDSHTRSLQHILRNRERFTMVLPKKISSIARVRKVVLGLLILGGVGIGVAWQMGDPSLRAVGPEILGLIAAAVGGIVVVLWGWEGILGLRMRSGSFNDLHVSKKIEKELTLLGARAEGLLRIFLCKDQLLKRPAIHSNCTKPACRDHRKLLKEKEDNIEGMVESVLNVDWCSTCKKRLVFDEYLPFQPNPIRLTADATGEEEARQRNAYLQAELERMVKWAREVGPCNCSKLYWSNSTREIVLFKKREKDIEARLAAVEKK